MWFSMWLSVCLTSRLCVSSLTQLSLCESLLLAHEEELNRDWIKVFALFQHTHTHLHTHLCFQDDFIYTGWLTNPDITQQECWLISSRGEEIPAVCVCVFICCVGLHGAPKMMNSLYFLSSLFFFSLSSLMSPPASPFLCLPFLLSID